MVQSIIKNADKYLELLSNLLSEHSMISDPKHILGLIEISECNGKTVGWQIDNTEIRFHTDDIVDCDEGAFIYGDRYIISYFSYHFSPLDRSTLRSYRIDSNNGDLHLNPDDSLISLYGRHISPEFLDLNINDFNCVLAIHLALLYIRQGIYPADTRAVEYNKALDGIRRKLA